MSKKPIQVQNQLNKTATSAPKKSHIASPFSS